MAIPDYFVETVLDINLDLLRERGINTLLLDLDNTVLPRDKDEIPEDIAEWMRSLPEKGFKVCLLSNNWHGRIQEVAGEFGYELVSKAVKPLPPAFLMALKRIGAQPRETAMVGDQFFTDVLGASFLTMTTVMVRPLSQQDLTHTLMLRKLERLIMGDRQPEEMH